MMKNPGAATGTSGDPAIRVRGLHVVRGGHEVIPALDLDVPRGQVIGLLGPSGCGKTTLMRALVGVQVVAGGTIDVLGHPAGSRPLRSMIGYVTQAPSVYADLTVTENLRYFAAVAGVPRARVGGEVQRLLDAVDLHARADAKVANLSGGQRSRVSLAAALAGSPQLLVLDEPTVGLDPVLRKELWDIFARLAASGVTLLVSSHVMDEASRCDRLLLMREGRLLADGTLAEVLADTGTSAVEDAFLALVARDAAAAGTTSPVSTVSTATEVTR